ncbi:MAG: hypothetical protein OWQ54_01805 [Sulfolobaceae archaeon]|nr:hypothetical protein [Sulfolobaceae archaeon]
MKNVIFYIITSNLNELPNIIRTAFRDCIANKSINLVLNIITDEPYHEVIKFAREALLDNIELGIELFVWKRNEIDKMIEKIKDYDIKGIINNCSKEERYNAEKVLEKLPQDRKTLLIKDYCK